MRCCLLRKHYLISLSLPFCICFALNVISRCASMRVRICICIYINFSEITLSAFTVYGVLEYKFAMKTKFLNKV